MLYTRLYILGFIDVIYIYKYKAYTLYLFPNIFTIHSVNNSVQFYLLYPVFNFDSVFGDNEIHNIHEINPVYLIVQILLANDSEYYIHIK